jgi:tRNA modification GTPase
MEADTIVAVVTPPGEGGVGIVRASGPLARALPATFFPDLPSPWRSHRLRQGRLVDGERGVGLDEAMGVVMLAPHSYTGEDVFEIHCHGSPRILERVLALCLAQGCRGARPGEFTLRAFLNGRLDLSQAEAVNDVVRARTNAGLEVAVRQLEGWLGERIGPIRGEIVGTLAHMEALVDFVEDDIPPDIDTMTRTRLVTALETVDSLLAGAREGIILREGASLCLLGSPNVGKSSIMNTLLGMNRSIVTAVPGTTRDTVEELLDLGGVPFRAVDTAGITDTVDEVERIGVERGKQSAAAADVVVLVLDGSRSFNREDAMSVQAVREARQAGNDVRIVVAINKSDLPQMTSLPDLDALDPVAVVPSSTLIPGGLDALRDALERAALGGVRRGEFVVGNVRHQDSLRRAAAALRAALDALDQGLPLDLASFDVRAAAAALGEITGDNVDDELLDRIFREFCIGK